ncbi:MAG: hypothetical protein IPM39_13100 [Chloroflexi bacterium]|nr:hypothetical protein [Chloroflexota bacterium]
MSETKDVLAQDLRILETMIVQIEAYLDSDATYWPLNQAGMPPKLTIGGCLMRQTRLLALKNKLAIVDQVRLDKAIGTFNGMLQEKVVRFENRSNDELHARLREWSSYLRNATSRMATEQEYYANTVDTRLVIAALMDKLQTPPYHLKPQITNDVAQMDSYLQKQWQRGEFVLTAVWQEAYPENDYWWLYGRPKA